MDNENLFPFGDMLDNLDDKLTEPINPAAIVNPMAPVQDSSESAEFLDVPIGDIPEVDTLPNTSDNGDEADVKEKKERKKPNRPITTEDADFVIKNLKTMSYPEMATARGLTKHQVSRILTETRKELREKARTPEEEAKIEAFITANLTKPDDQRGSAGGEVKTAIKAIAHTIYKSL